MEPLQLYRQVARARAFELALGDLWRRGLVSGEMHLGTGEEAIAAGVVTHLEPGDAVALDHRPTPVMLLLGVDPVALLRECLGRQDGLCHGAGGHMHLFSREHLAASSGIVGSAGPVAAGFALAARALREGSVAVAFFGDGAANQGMLLESLNLAGVWALPLVFVCKQNGWAITTRTKDTTSGSLAARARGFGLETDEVDGADVFAVERAAGRLLSRARTGKGPGFLLARCPRLDGHFLGDPLLRAADHPVAEGGALLAQVLEAATARGGGGVVERTGSLLRMMNAMRLARSAGRSPGDDPLERAREALRFRRVEVGHVDSEVAEETERLVELALEPEAAR